MMFKWFTDLFKGKYEYRVVERYPGNQISEIGGHLTLNEAIDLHREEFQKKLAKSDRYRSYVPFYNLVIQKREVFDWKDTKPKDLRDD